MGRLVIADKPKSRLEVIESNPRRRITPEEVEAGLSAERVVEVPVGGSPFSTYAVRQELFRRLRSTGGRPGINGADIKPKIPMDRRIWKTLEELTKTMEYENFHPTPGQLASIILSDGVTRFLANRRLGEKGINLRADRTDEIAQLVNATLYPTWRKYAEKLVGIGSELFGYAEIPITEKGASDARVVAMALLCRTISNLKGTTILVDAGRIIEARILARSCIENLIYVGALREEGDKFVKEMALDGLANRKALAEILLNRKPKDAEQKWEAPLRAFLRRHKSGQNVKKSLSPKGIARDTMVRDAYVFYAQLSGDSAHPTTDALSRYFVRTKESDRPERGLDMEPLPKATEQIETIKYACEAGLGVCVGVNEIVGGTAVAASIAQAMNEYETITLAQAGSTQVRVQK